MIGVVAFGEILWDLLPDGPVLGGAPFNFAYRCSTLGMDSRMVSSLGRDELGDRALEQMRVLGMSIEHVQRDPDRPTGTVDVAVSETGDPSYTIVQDVAYDSIRMLPDLEAVVRGAQCLCFGTLAQRSAVSKGTLSALLDCFAGRCRLLDINLRDGCYTAQSVASSLTRADILKMNDEEAPLVAGMAGIGGTTIREIAEGLLRGYGLAYCVVTLGERGSYALSADGQEVLLGAYSVDVADTCGSGDAFTAAFISEILRGRGLEEAVRTGNALGAMVAMQKGATQPVAPQDLRAFVEDRDPAPAPDLR